MIANDCPCIITSFPTRNGCDFPASIITMPFQERYGSACGHERRYLASGQVSQRSCRYTAPLPRFTTRARGPFDFCASPISSAMRRLYVSESCCRLSRAWSRCVNANEVEEVRLLRASKCAWSLGRGRSDNESMGERERAQLELAERSNITHTW
jgi:hypothetical protein